MSECGGESNNTLWMHAVFIRLLANLCLKLVHLRYWGVYELSDVHVQYEEWKKTMSRSESRIFTAKSESTL